MGASIGVRRSALAQRAFGQLGATGRPGRRRLTAGFDGVEAGLAEIESTGSTSARPRWPPTSRCGPACSSLVANPKAWERTRPAAQEGRCARPARRVAAGGDRTTAQSSDEEVYGVLCRRGAVSFARATAADTGALRRRVRTGHARPRHRHARGDRASSAKEAGPPPAHPPCRPPAARETGARDADRRRVGVRERRVRPSRGAKGTDDDLTPENWGHYVFAFWRGRFAITQEAPRGLHVGLRDVLACAATG